MNKNRPRVLNIDFDDTICRTRPGAPWGRATDFGMPLPYAVEAINALKEEGYYIIIWTARYLEPDLADVKSFLDLHGIHYDKINEPCDYLQYKSWPKIFCDTQIDDNSLLNVDWRFLPHFVHFRTALQEGVNFQLRNLVSDEMAERFYSRTVEHIKRVIKYVNKFMDDAGLFGGFEDFIDVAKSQDALSLRARTHDASKFSDALVIQYVLLTEKFRMKSAREPWTVFEHEDEISQVEVREAKRILKGILKEATDAHYAGSDHHPQFWDDVKKMPAEALIEMCADWCAMSEENKNDPIEFFRSQVRNRYPWGEDQVAWIEKVLGVMWGFYADKEED